MKFCDFGAISKSLSTKMGSHTHVYWWRQAIQQCLLLEFLIYKVQPIHESIFPWMFPVIQYSCKHVYNHA